MLVSVRKPNMLQLVAQCLTLGTAGTGAGYDQGKYGGQDTTTGEQCGMRSSLLLKL